MGIVKPNLTKSTAPGVVQQLCLSLLHPSGYGSTGLMRVQPHCEEDSAILEEVIHMPGPPGGGEAQAAHQVLEHRAEMALLLDSTNPGGWSCSSMRSKWQ